jgi:hypothetical protein
LWFDVPGTELGCVKNCGAAYIRVCFFPYLWFRTWMSCTSVNLLLVRLINCFSWLVCVWRKKNGDAFYIEMSKAHTITKKQLKIISVTAHFTQPGLYQIVTCANTKQKGYMVILWNKLFLTETCSIGKRVQLTVEGRWLLKAGLAVRVHSMIPGSVHRVSLSSSVMRSIQPKLEVIYKQTFLYWFEWLGLELMFISRVLALSLNLLLFQNYYLKDTIITRLMQPVQVFFLTSVYVSQQSYSSPF